MKRSYLFVPGNRPERFGKAVASGAGAVILDLEDAVPPEAKASARDAVCQWLREHPGAAWVRINGVDTEFYEMDLKSLGNLSPLGFVLPKAEAAVELPGPVIPIIESALGLWNALEVARGPGVQRLAFGSVDFQLDAGIQGEDEALLYARSQLVLVSRIARLESPIDGVTVQIGDEERLRRDVERSRDLGFGAKLCIHPNQVAAVEKGFAPSEEELRWARAVVGAFEQAAGNAVRLEGKLIDLPVVERAKRLLI